MLFCESITEKCESSMLFCDSVKKKCEVSVCEVLSKNVKVTRYFICNSIGNSQKN